MYSAIEIEDMTWMEVMNFELFYRKSIMFFFDYCGEHIS